MNERDSGPHAFEVRDLVVSYDERRALDGVSLAVPQGAVVGLLGPNGSGKSTLLSVVAGLRSADGGEVRVFGEAPSPAARARVGAVFQESCLDPLMTLHETLSLHGRLFGLGGGKLQDRIQALLEQVALADRARDAVRTLSGGMRRRLELARALLPSPQLLLLDEPTSGLDLDSRRAFWERLAQSRRRGFPASPPGSAEPGKARLRGRSSDGEHGLTILLATNDVLEAERECDTIAFLHQGRLVAQGTPAELKAGLKHDSVRVECVQTDGHADQLAALSDTIAGWPGVGSVTQAGGILHATVDDASSFVPRLFEAGGEGIHTIHIESSTLEDAYFQLAGASLSSSEEAVTG